MRRSFRITRPACHSLAFLTAVSLVLALGFTPEPLSAQRSLEAAFQLAAQIEFPPVQGWRASKVDSAGAESLGFNDSGWEKFSYQPVLDAEQCWFRSRFKLPERIALQPVKGRKVELSLTVLSDGTLYVDGKPSARLKAGENKVTLAASAEPGREYLVALRLSARHQKVTFREARLTLPGWEAAVEKARDLRVQLYSAYRLLSGDTHQRAMQLESDPGTDLSSSTESQRLELINELESALERIDHAALEQGRPADFIRSVDAAVAAAPRLTAYMHSFTLRLVSNAHIDLAWLWRWRETVEAAHDTFESVLGLMDKYPELTFTQSQAQLYEWMRQYYPDTFERIRRRVAEGRWEIAGGMWVEPDCNLIGPESWMRQILYAKAYFKEHFGQEIKLGWNPDSFGYNWNMPQFFSRCGIGAFVTQKLLWNDTNIFPYHLFWWRGPDNSRILVYMPYSGYTNVVDPQQMLDDLRQFEAGTGLRNMAVLIGYGDHGGGPDEDMLQRARHLRTLALFPRVEFGRMDQYLAALPDSVLARLPEWNSELYLEYHRGTYTSQAKMKEYNRRLESGLASAETVCALDALLTGAAYPAARLTEAWKKVLFNQMHDILPGSGIAAVYTDAAAGFERAAALSAHATEVALSGIGAAVNTARGPEGEPLIVFNSLSWLRSSTAEYTAPSAVLRGVRLYGPDGTEVPCQVVEDDSLTARLIFRANAVPATGYKVYRLRRTLLERRMASGGDPGLSVSERAIENGLLRLELDPASGNVIRLYDKRARREVLSKGGRGNLIQLFEDRPAQWDAWNIGYTGRSWELDKADKIEVVERGPVRATVRVRRSFLGPTKPRRQLATSFPSSFFSTEISLYRDEPLVEVRCRIEWWEDQVLAKTAWELNVKSDSAYYETPGAAIARPTTRANSWDRARFEVPGLRWADLSEGAFGVSLLSRSKYGYDTEGGRLRLTLLKSPLWPDPSADRGSHEITYAIYPHAGDWREAATVQRAAEYCTPLLFHCGVNHPGRLPGDQAGFLSVSPAQVELGAFKAAEDGDGFVLRCYESTGKACRAEVNLPPGAVRACTCSPLEEPGAELALSGGKVSFDLGPFESRTIRVYFRTPTLPGVAQ
ncbi:glycosyl hydrolase-related protein [bacterium]|nr:glycosyl hydrolase-related protein [bacterium]